MGFFQLLACVTAIGENMSDAGEACAYEAGNARRSVAVLNVSFVHNACQHYSSSDGLGHFFAFLERVLWLISVLLKLIGFQWMRE